MKALRRYIVTLGPFDEWTQKWPAVTLEAFDAADALVQAPLLAATQFRSGPQYAVRTITPLAPDDDDCATCREARRA